MSIDLNAVIAAVKIAGYGDDIEWAENLEPPATANDFALEVIFVIVNSGMRFSVARGIYNRVTRALANGGSSSDVFNHVGKCGAIDAIWRERAAMFQEYLAAADKLSHLETLPWVGPITKYHLAKNFGHQCAKPDVHLQRLADTFRTSPQALCETLALEHGLKVATVDTLLWRAAAIGKLDTSTGLVRP